MRGVMLCLLWALAACGPRVVASPQQEAFGITMVEETECNGRGGRITEGPNGSYCAGGADI